jgi:arylsulfatase A-like enzyme
MPLLLLLALAIPQAATSEEERTGRSPARPDIVLIIADDLAESDLDHIPTAHVDRLAARGMRFRRAYANPLCIPSRHSLLFGTWWDRWHGDSCTPGTEESLDPAMFGLGTLMKQAGYATGYFGKWHLGSNRQGPWETTVGLFGFDAYRAIVPQGVNSCGGKAYDHWLRVDDGESAISREYVTDAIRDAALAWWAEDHGSAPRFAILSLQAPHAPQHMPPATSLPARYPRPRTTTDREKYVAMVVSVDEVVGSVLDAVGDEVLVLFLGDNGTPRFGMRPDQKQSAVKYSTREDGIRVPFVVAGPGVAARTETRALIHLVDVLPTLAELLDAPVPDSLDGRSFAHVLRDPAAAPLRPYVYCSRKPFQAVVLGRHKLHRSLLPEDEPWTLFDLVLDPREEHPLDLDDPALADVMERMHEIFAAP